MDARQRKDQTAQSFNSFLLGLEDQLDESYTPVQLRGHLWCKLRPDMRSSLSNYQEIPQTREALVTLATRMENNKRRATMTQPAGEREPKRLRLEPQERASNPRFQPSPNNRFRTPNPNQIPVSSPNRTITNPTPAKPTAERRCYNCGRVGHFKDQCPDLVREVAQLYTRESEGESENDPAS
jgi:hypothetical protein